MGRPRVSIDKRLSLRTTKRGECLVWIGPVGRDGYPRLQSADYGRATRANRVIWMHLRGQIPDGLVVCHKCDEPLCLNIDHLFLGTPLDNTLDMIQKNRKALMLGEANGRAKLTDSQVVRLRAERATGKTLASLAKEFGICPAQVRRICLSLSRKEMPLCA